jgi:sporulation protein YlmC with PRC-barrel domain
MNRFLVTTAVGLFIGITPALAQDQAPQDETMSPPAIQSPANPADAPSVIDSPNAPSAIDNPLPSASEPAPSQSSEAAPSAAEPAQSQSSEAAPSAAEPAPSQSSEASPQSIAPPDESAAGQEQSADARSGNAKFLDAQKSSDLLASNLIGQSVVNVKNEAIGNINDLVTDDSGKVVAVLVGAGGFLGIGEKELAVPFEDLKIARDANNDLAIILSVDQEMIVSAPDYQRLDEQQTVQGENKTDREDNDATRTY